MNMTNGSLRGMICCGSGSARKDRSHLQKVSLTSSVTIGQNKQIKLVETYGQRGMTRVGRWNELLNPDL